MKQIKKVFNAIAIKGDEVIGFESFNHKEPITNVLFEVLSRKYNVTFEYKTIANLRRKENVGFQTVQEVIWTLSNFRKQSMYDPRTNFNPYRKGFDFEGYRIFVYVKEVEVEVELKVLRPMEEFNGYTPQDSLIDPFETNDERLSDAIKRLQVLINEAR